MQAGGRAKDGPERRLPPTREATTAATAGDGAVAVRPDATFERTWLDDHSWVDVARGWLDGANALFDSLVERAAWRQGRLWRYEKWVEEPRLTAWCGLGPTGASVPDPALLPVHRAVRARCGVSFDGFAMNLYRDGRDGQAFHRDRDLRWLDDTVIALLILGARRPFLLRPVANRHAHEAPGKGATHDLSPAGGDLIVMGGACQVGWEHSVPQAPSVTGGRISVQWRWTSRKGRPEQGASYRAPRHFSR